MLSQNVQARLARSSVFCVVSFSMVLASQDGSHLVEGDEQECRRARPSDVAHLLPIWSIMMREHAAKESALMLSAEAQTAWSEMVTAMIAREDAFVFVTGPYQKPWAFCLGWIARNPKVYQTREVGFISELAVASHVRRRGQGRRLVEAARLWFEEQGLTRFQLTTAKFNKEARAFWRSVGGRALLVRYQFDVAAAHAMQTH